MQNRERKPGLTRGEVLGLTLGSVATMSTVIRLLVDPLGLSSLDNWQKYQDSFETRAATHPFYERILVKCNLNCLIQGKWDHRCNSRQDLMAALTNSQVDFIEIDLWDDQIKHGQHDRSDISLIEALELIWRYQKGIKFDIKNAKALALLSGLVGVGKRFDPHDLPMVMININALDHQGDVREFDLRYLKNKEFFNGTIISLGMQVSWFSLYSAQKISQLANLAKALDINRPTTFALRADAFSDWGVWQAIESELLAKPE